MAFFDKLGKKASEAYKIKHIKLQQIKQEN